MDSKKPESRKLHLEHIERWAEYVRTHKDWKKIHTEFINAQFQKHREILEKLRQTPEGRKKIIKLYDIKNLDGYSKLLNP